MCGWMIRGHPQVAGRGALATRETSRRRKANTERDASTSIQRRARGMQARATVRQLKAQKRWKLAFSGTMSAGGLLDKCLEEVWRHSDALAVWWVLWC